MGSGWGVGLVRSDARGASGGGPRDEGGVDEGGSADRGSPLHLLSLAEDRDSPCDPRPDSPARQPRPAATHFLFLRGHAAAAARGNGGGSERALLGRPFAPRESDRRAEQTLVSSGTLDAPGTTERGGSDGEADLARRRRGREISLGVSLLFFSEMENLSGSCGWR